MTEPHTYEWHYVKERLRLWDYEIQELLKVGMIAPVGRNSHGRPLFCPEAIEKLATKEERARIKDALCWFELLQHSGFTGAQKETVAENPHYPFDSEEQHTWAYEIFLNKPYGNLPTDHAIRVRRRMKKNEDIATKAFAKAHKTREFRGFDALLRRRWKMTRAQVHKLVWSKTMIRAAADLKMSEFTLRKLCRKYGEVIDTRTHAIRRGSGYGYLIPTPALGHFNHHDPKDRARRPRLPTLKRLRPPVIKA